MKPLRYWLFVGIASFILAISCNEEPMPSPGVIEEDPTRDTIFFSVAGLKMENGEVRDITQSSATIVGSFSSLDNNNFPVTEHGHVWSSNNALPTLANAEGSTQLGIRDVKGQFFSNLADLQAGAVYYYRSYVSSNGDIRYHDRSSSFTTKELERPEVVTVEKTFVDDGAFQLRGEILEFNEIPVSSHGFVWIEAGKNSPPTLGNNDGSVNIGAIQPGDSHTFEALIEGLAESTAYQACAFARNEAGISYGNVLLIYGKLIPDQYAGIPKEFFDTLYVETFSDNLHEWFEGNDSGCEFDIAGGVYTGECNGTNFYSYCRSCNLSHEGNFELELDIRVLADGNSCSLNWGGYNSWANVNRFGIDGERKFIIARTENEEQLPAIAPLSPSALINQSGFNKLTVRFFNGVHYFFINESFLLSSDQIVFYGDEVSIRTGDGASCQFDNLTVKRVDF